MIQMNKPVIKELPVGVMERQGPLLEYREAYGFVGGVGVWYHFCPRCDGWVEGYPVERRINTLELLSGRQGKAEYCARCNYELAFRGAVA